MASKMINKVFKINQFQVEKLMFVIKPKKIYFISNNSNSTFLVFEIKKSRGTNKISVTFFKIPKDVRQLGPGYRKKLLSNENIGKGWQVSDNQA